MIKNINDIKEILEENIDELINEFDIKLIYVFGSYAKQTNTDQSDIDIAVLIDGEINRHTRLNILGLLVDLFRREDIDLVILNNVDEVLRFQVIKYGENIYMDSLYTRTMFESNVMSKYMDMEYFRRIQQEYTHGKFLKTMNYR